MRILSKKLIMIFTIISMLSLWILPAYAVPAVSLSLSETTFSPNDDGFRDSTIVLFNFSGSVRATVRVLRGTSVVATLHNNVSLVGGPRAFVWGGTTGLTGGPGLPNGRYTMQVLVTDGSGTGSARGDFIIARNLIGPGSIENGAITRDKIAFDAIDGSRVAPKSLGAREISLIVGNAELGNDAVTSNKIKDGEVSNADLAGGIDPTKITGGVWTSTNDGSGSGLDADTVDGVHASGFAVAGHNHDAAYVNDDAGEVDNADIPNGTLNPQKIAGTALTTLDEGSGNGLDADTVDGVHASGFAVAGHNHDAAYVNDDAGEVDNADIPNGTLNPQKIAGTALTTLDEGSGNGLDADTLDGLDSASFVDNSAAIVAEAATRADADTALFGALTSEGTTRATDDAAEVVNRDAAIAAEATTRAADDAVLVGLITTETIDRTAADAAEVVARDAAIAVEATTRATDDATLVAALTSEGTTRGDGDALLFGLITTETIDRTAADAAEVVARDAAIAVEATTRATDDAALLAALTSEATTRAAADANRLDSSALGTGVRMESGVTTVTVGSLGVQGPVTASIAAPFLTSPLILLTVDNLGPDYAGTSIADLIGSATTDTVSISLKVTDVSSGASDFATIRWVAIGN